MRAVVLTSCPATARPSRGGRGASHLLRPNCIRKEHYFTRGAPKIIVMNDAKSMAGFMNTDLEKVENSRAQAMLEELQPYQIEVKHVPGPKMEFLDHGSRNPIFYGQHKVFDTEVGSLGICVR